MACSVFGPVTSVAASIRVCRMLPPSDESLGLERANVSMQVTFGSSLKMDLET